MERDGERGIHILTGWDKGCFQFDGMGRDEIMEIETARDGTSRDWHLFNVWVQWPHGRVLKKNDGTGQDGTKSRPPKNDGTRRDLVPF